MVFNGCWVLDLVGPNLFSKLLVLVSGAMLCDVCLVFVWWRCWLCLFGEVLYCSVVCWGRWWCDVVLLLVLLLLVVCLVLSFLERVGLKCCLVFWCCGVGVRVVSEAVGL
jgi:hypothetical protein